MQRVQNYTRVATSVSLQYCTVGTVSVPCIRSIPKHRIPRSVVAGNDVTRPITDGRGDGPPLAQPCFTPSIRQPGSLDPSASWRPFPRDGRLFLTWPHFCPRRANLLLHAALAFRSTGLCSGDRPCGVIGPKTQCGGREPSQKQSQKRLMQLESAIDDSPPRFCPVPAANSFSRLPITP